MSLPRRDQRKFINSLAADLEAKPKRKKFVSAHDLMKDGCGIVRSADAEKPTSLFDSLKDFIGKAQGLPEDFSPKRRLARREPQLIFAPCR